MNDHQRSRIQRVGLAAGLASALSATACNSSKLQQIQQYTKACMIELLRWLSETSIEPGFSARSRTSGIVVDFITAITGGVRAIGAALVIASIGGSSGCVTAGAIASDQASGIVESLEVLHDDSRARDVPIKIYATNSGGGPFPVILFSHGLGSSRQGYVYLGREWARRGYVSIHVQHVGSDSELLRKKGLWAIYRAVFNGQQYADRPRDISFVIDVLERRARAAESGSLWGKLDLSRIGVGGHSYGAHTTLTLVGMLVNFPQHDGRSFRDARVKAALIISPPAMAWSPTAKEFAPIHSPTMHMSGSRDTSRLWRITLLDRRRAFDCIRAAPRYFLNIEGAAHSTFADHETMLLAKRNGRLDRTDPPRLRSRNAEHQRQIDLILEFSDAFWDAYLMGSDAAASWLDSVEPSGAALERGE